jgi:hypothetical protein
VLKVCNGRCRGICLLIMCKFNLSHV